MPIGYGAHRNTNEFWGTFRIGNLTVTTTGVSAKSTTSELANRHRLIIINDSSNLVYGSNSSGFVIADGVSFVVYSGVTQVFDLDPNDDTQKIWLKSDELTLELKIIEEAY